jgi:hypothetical protein
MRLQATARLRLCSMPDARDAPCLSRVVKHRMLGKLTSVEKGPERNVRLVIRPSGVFSEISTPPGTYDPQTIDYYEITGLQQHDSGVVALTFVMADQRKVLFYATEQKFDMVLLLDELDATIGERRRVDPRENA